MCVGSVYVKSKVDQPVIRVSGYIAERRKGDAACQKSTGRAAAAAVQARASPKQIAMAGCGFRVTGRSSFIRKQECIKAASLKAAELDSYGMKGQQLQKPAAKIREPVIDAESVISRSPGFEHGRAAPFHGELRFEAPNPGVVKKLYRNLPERNVTRDNFAECLTYQGANHCAMEFDMWLIVMALVTPDSTVLELGARWGTTSCVLAAATNNSGRVASVDPDTYAHPALSANRDRHWCNFHMVQSTVAARAMVHAGKGKTSKGYAFSVDFAGALAAPASSRSRQTTRPSALPLPNLPYPALERALNLRFDTLVLDCEGCVESTLFGTDGTYPPLIDQLRLLIVEHDRSQKVQPHPCMHILAPYYMTCTIARTHAHAHAHVHMYDIYPHPRA